MLRSSTVNGSSFNYNLSNRDTGNIKMVGDWQKRSESGELSR
jgi:hypothetical protein